ncbi:MAG: hypothetical protein ACI9VR_002198 [Cognaticolwellia sp.]|jgi:hypothetical protein
MFFVVLACLGSALEPELPSEPAPRAQPAKNLILIVLDTTREDMLLQAATPTIDALAARGERVERAWSGGTWTVPGVSSMMLGMPVRAHGWDLGSGRLGRYPPLPSEPLLAEVLQEQGFATIGLHTNPYLAEELGFDRGFDVWRRVSDQIMARELEKELARTWSPDGRNFVYLHYIGPHSPVNPSEAQIQGLDLDASWYEGRGGMEIGVAKRGRLPGAREAYGQGYLGVLADTDARLAQALALLEPYMEDSVVILTSDHGEMLGEQGVVGHGTWVHEPLTWVPYVAVGLGRSLPETLSTTATPALVCQALGIAHDWPVQVDGPVVSQREGQFSLLLGQEKGVWEPGEAPYSVDLSAAALGGSPQAPSAEMLAAKTAFERAFPAAALPLGLVELPAETQEQLKAMGYTE